MFNLNIKAKIATVSLSISIISVLIISVLFNYIYGRSIISSTVEMNNQSTTYLSDYLNNYFKKIELTSVELYNIVNEPSLEPVKISVLDIIKNGYSDNASDYYMERQILNNYFIFIQNQRKSIGKTVVLDQNQNIVDIYNRNIVYSRIDLDPIIEKYINQNDDKTVFSSYIVPEINKNLLIYKKEIYDLFTHEKIATLLYFIDYDGFEWEKYNLQNNQFMVLNQYNEFIYHSDPTYLSKKANQDLIEISNHMENKYSLHNKELINYVQLDNTELKLINIASLDELYKNKTMARYITLLIVLAAVVLNSIVSILYALRITKPINILCNTMKEVEKGNFSVKIPETNGTDEMSVLNKNFNYMTSKIKDMIQFQYELEIRNREAQLMVLQSQINPHFLYNTLQTIGGMAILNNDYDISIMCKALSDIFRYSIQNDKKETTLDNELFHISNYLYIQKIRYDDCIDVNINISEDLKTCLVPRIILQPIIENSILHGIEKIQMDREIIDINIEKHHNNLLIIIEDNGPGIDETKLKSVTRHIGRQPMEVSSGLTQRPSIGLRNVNARIKIFYGEQYGIEIFNKDTKGVKVVMTLPYNKEDSNV